MMDGQSRWSIATERVKLSAKVSFICGCIMLYKSLGLAKLSLDMMEFLSQFGVARHMPSEMYAMFLPTIAAIAGLIGAAFMMSNKRESACPLAIGSVLSFIVAYKINSAGVTSGQYAKELEMLADMMKQETGLSTLVYASIAAAFSFGISVIIVLNNTLPSSGTPIANDIVETIAYALVVPFVALICDAVYSLAYTSDSNGNTVSQKTQNEDRHYTQPATSSNGVCAKCHAALKPNAKFCSKCGAAVVTAKPAEPQAASVMPDTPQSDHHSAEHQASASAPEHRRVHYRCPKCHHDVDADTTVCPGCGVHLKPHKSPQAQHKTVHYRCPKCHHELDAGTTVCPGCGVHLKPHKSPQAQHKTVHSRCPKCHHELDAGTTVCPGCGVHLKLHTVNESSGATRTRV